MINNIQINKIQINKILKCIVTKNKYIKNMKNIYTLLLLGLTFLFSTCDLHAQRYVGQAGGSQRKKVKIKKSKFNPYVVLNWNVNQHNLQYEVTEFSKGDFVSVYRGRLKQQLAKYDANIDVNNIVLETNIDGNKFYYHEATNSMFESKRYDLLKTNGQIGLGLSIKDENGYMQSIFQISNGKYQWFSIETTFQSRLYILKILQDFLKYKGLLRGISSDNPLKCFYIGLLLGYDSSYPSNYQQLNLPSETHKVFIGMSLGVECDISKNVSLIGDCKLDFTTKEEGNQSSFNIGVRFGIGKK